MEADKIYFKESYIKILLYIFGVLAVLYTVTSRTFTDAILNFCFAGIVPGTDIVIDPQTMLMGQAIIAGLFVVTALMIYLYRKVSFRRTLSAGMIIIPVAPKIHKTKKTVATQYHMVLRKRPEAAISLSPVVYAAVRKVIYLFQEAIIKAIVLAWIVCDAVRVSGSTCWTRIRPYAERFDMWLEVRYRKVISVISLFIMRYERFQFLAMIIHQVRQSVRHLFK